MSFFAHLEGLVSSQFAMAKNFWTLLKLEAKLAETTIFPLFLTLAFLIAFCLSTWFLSLVIIGYLLFLWTGQVLLSLCVLFFLNIILLGLSLKLISTYIKQLSFTKTRAFLSRGNHALTEKAKVSYRKDRAEIALSKSNAR